MIRFVFFAVLFLGIASCDFIEKKINHAKNHSASLAIDTVLYSVPTTIQFVDTSVDLGDIKAGVEKTITYKYQNTGDKPLILFNVSPSCGCTIADFSREPLPPHGVDSIMARFDSKGKEGSYIKYIKVLANTAEKTHNISFKVNVIK